MFENTDDMLRLNVGRYPQNTAIVYGDRRFTYTELNERINCLAHHLMDVGIQKGDRVGFMLPNSNQFVELFYATQKIAAVAVPLNIRMISQEVKWALDNMRCKVFAYSETFAGQIEPVKHDLSTVEHLICSGESPPFGEHHFEAFTREGNTTEPQVSVEFHDPSFIVFTGGTTGIPKAALHTRGSALFGTIMVSKLSRIWEPDDLMITQVPMFHVGGLYIMQSMMAAGGGLVLVDAFDPLQILKLIEQERATHITFFPPTLYIRLMDVPNLKDFDTSSVTHVAGSAGALPKELMLRLFDTFPSARILYGIGSTETSGAVASLAITRSMVEKDSARVGSVGRAAPFVEVRLVDETGQDVPLGEPGEALVRSPAVMKEYFDQPELTAQAIKDGWFHTGDLLKKDEGGYFYFVGRNKDMIKSGGENVFAEEVEKVILSYPAVANCAVIGIPDPRFGEAVIAVVQLRQGLTATEEEIVEHCRKSLSSYKKPRRVAFVDTLPVSPAGKIQKFRLKEEYGK